MLPVLSGDMIWRARIALRMKVVMKDGQRIF